MTEMIEMIDGEPELPEEWKMGTVVTFKASFSTKLAGMRFEICWPDPVAVRVHDGRLLVELVQLDRKRPARRLAWIDTLVKCE
jgi:hypothetical protein